MKEIWRKLRSVGMAMKVMEVTVCNFFIRARDENVKSSFFRFMPVIYIERCRDL